MSNALRVTAVVLCMVLLHNVAWASGDNSSEGSGNSSGESSNSSQGSGESSKNSSESSNDGATGESSANSSQGSTEQTTKGSSEGDGGRILSVIGALVVLGGLVAIGVVLTVRSGRDEQVAEAKLLQYLQRQHPVIVHDIAVADGPVLASWSHDLGLNAQERQELAHALDGSPEQAQMLRALSSGDGRPNARLFAQQFGGLLKRALGETRAREVATRLAMVQ